MTDFVEIGSLHGWSNAGQLSIHDQIPSIMHICLLIESMDNVVKQIALTYI